MRIIPVVLQILLLVIWLTSSEAWYETVSLGLEKVINGAFKTERKKVRLAKDQRKSFTDDVYDAPPVYPWTEELYEDNNAAILSKLRNEMTLEVKRESLPGILRAQAAMQESVMSSKSKREWAEAEHASREGSHKKKAKQQLELDQEREKHRDLVNDMLNSSATMRNAYGELFVAQVVLRDENGKPRYELADKIEHVKKTMHASPAEQKAKRRVKATSRTNLDPAESLHSQRPESEDEEEEIIEESTKPEAISNIQRLHNRLEGLCLTMPTGYWTYEWCFANSLKQFHMEQIHRENGQVVEFRRTNDVDLGFFKGSRIGRLHGDDQNTTAPITKLTESYKGGPPCDVGSQKVDRNALVTLQCCSTSMEQEKKNAPPTGVDPSVWYQMQSLIRATNVPDDPMILHNPNNPNVQPAAIRTVQNNLKSGNDHLANYHGQHHPPHNTPHHSGALLDKLAQVGQAPEGKERYDQWGHLAGFMEPNMCGYHLIACIPILCTPDDASAAASMPEQASNKLTSENDPQSNQYIDLTAVLKSLQHQCLVRQEDWWTYEICFKTGIRQFHLHADVKLGSDGNAPQTTMTVNSEYLLGKAPVATYRNRLLLEASTSGGFREGLQSERIPDVEVGMMTSVLQRSYRPKVLVLEFMDGTACDIESTKRSTTVEVSCGTGVDAITDIVEDRTCHYHIKVDSAQICKVDGFSKAEQKLELVEFLPHEKHEVYRMFMQDNLQVEETRDLEKNFDLKKQQKLSDIALKQSTVMKPAGQLERDREMANHRAAKRATEASPAKRKQNVEVNQDGTTTAFHVE